MKISAARQQFALRMPDGMLERVRKSADANRRSMNSEIVHYLDRALAADETKSPAAIGVAPGSDHPNHSQQRNSSDELAS